MTFNDIVIWMLRSPLHGLLGANSMLIQVTGRKTGLPVCLPVNFQREGGAVWVISSRDRVWWRNLRDNPRADLWIGGRQIKARAQLVLDESIVLARLEKVYARDRMLARALHVRLDEQKVPRQEDLQKAAQERLFVRLDMEE